ncbi:DNA cytosine methyltransferase [Streptococcus equi]|uniref:DNA cytosine methyltransferase n=1 Tax=Streptococcus equi TaxID=1336 RepID=UPI0022AB5896|nr:DNA (cytosine-5-)-methyltransferase [Streptococcus equi]MCD3418452.1 DNA (cytosine-5-)-methyltransferase [Streptococcus equi subsp. zooepidemicus]
MKEEEKMYKSIDLFAGIGGIRLGFDQAFKDDIKTVFVSEWDEKAVETYKANFNDSVDVVGDITKIDEKEIPEHDILLAGFPCQAFSLAGHKRGFEDARGTLFFDVARIIKEHKRKLYFVRMSKTLSTMIEGVHFR